MIRYRTIGIPLVAAGLVLGAYVAPERSEDRRPPAGVKVTQTTYACPAGNGITVAAGQVSPGTEGTATVLPGKRAENDLGGTKSWRTARVDGRGVLVEQQGRGSGPAGFFGSVSPKDGGGGLSVGSCSASMDAAWFLGLGSGVKHFSTVTLTNGSTAPAAVDLDLWGPNGKIDAVGAKGIVIKPNATRRVQLKDLAPGEPELALRVLRRRGAVSAVVSDFSTAVFRGTEPVTATSTPRRSQVIGGLIPGLDGLAKAGVRTLALLNPGTTTARVEVDVIGSKSTFKPEGLDAIKVKGESVRLIAVPSTAGGGRLALKVTSDVPVAATVRMATEALDYAYAESALPLEGPAIVPVRLGKGVSAPDLILTAPRRTASVQVFAYDRNMKELGEVTMSIEAETTKHLDIAKKFKQKGIAYLVVQTKGEVVGAATYRDGGRVSSLALLSAPIRVLAPQVRPIDVS